MFLVLNKKLFFMFVIIIYRNNNLKMYAFYMPFSAYFR